MYFLGRSACRLPWGRCWTSSRLTPVQRISPDTESKGVRSEHFLLTSLISFFKNNYISLPCRYRRIVKYKTSYYSFYLPVSLVPKLLILCLLTSSGLTWPAHVEQTFTDYLICMILQSICSLELHRSTYKVLFHSTLCLTP